MQGTRMKVRRRMISASYCNGSDTQEKFKCKKTAVKGWTQGMSNRLMAFIDNFRDDFTGMVTLTYPNVFPTDGREVKRHWRAFVERMRRAGYLSSGSFVWFLEFQARGAPHIHALVTSWISKNVVKRAWAQITGGSEDACSRVEALRNPDQAGKYARKYACKSEQKTVPVGFLNVGRMWGCVGPRHNEAGVPRVPCMEADIKGAYPCKSRYMVISLMQRIKEMKGVRLVDTMVGWCVYGTARQMEVLWLYLKDVLFCAGLSVDMRESTTLEMSGV